MPPTPAQQEEFVSLREQLAWMIRDLVEEEYNGLGEDEKTRGRHFFNDDVTAKQVWEEMILQWDAENGWCEDWTVTSINPEPIGWAGFNLTGAAERGLWVSICVLWRQNLQDFDEFSEEDGTLFLRAMKLAVSDMEAGLVVLEWIAYAA